MQRRLNHFMLLFVILAMVLTSAFRTTVVYADDGSTEPPTTGESTPPAEEGNSTDEAKPAAEPEVPAAEPAVEEAAPAPEATEQTPEEAEAPAVEVATQAEPPAAEPAAEEPAPAVEVLEQLPEDTDVIVLNDKGNPEPLATLDAAEIVKSGDPRYTVAGTTYYFMPVGGCGALANCVESTTPIQTAIDYLNGTNAASPWAGTGATPEGGMIYIDAGTYTENVTINGSTGWSAGSNKPASLTLSGAGRDPATGTTLNGSLSISNMNIFTVSGLRIVDADTVYDTALDVSNNSGTLTLTGVSVTNNRGNGADLQGTGNVVVTDSEFNGSSITGITVDTYGSATITNVQANDNGYGLEIIADQGISLTGVTASSNNQFGAILDTTYGTGSINVTNSTFGDSTDPATGNGWTGLHAESGDAISLNNVSASYNGTNGAYLVAEGNITVSNSVFNGNVQVGAPEDPGLFALSNGGNITLNDVTANANVHGAGVVLLTNGAGAININGGSFNQNGTFGIQAGSENGNITLADLVASYNQVKGAYLGAFWAGDITVSNSAFVENGSYGIYAFTSEGNINLNLVTVSGSDGAVGPGADNLTDYGAILEAGGDVTVTNSTFQLNTEVGLGIISGGQVNLNNVVADQNGGNGVEIYSITTAGPICEGDEPVNITITVNGGTFTDNGGYGLLAKPGPEGTVTINGLPNFTGNDLGEYLIDLSQEFEDCTCEPEPEEPPVTKGPKVVEVPSTGGPTVEQDCEMYSGTILKLPDGTWVEIGCPFEGFSKLEEVTPENLP
ncbi:MAG TPA: right-handed parallel beta-helix repeat-containing protein, partial [Anaerolineales bacterium]|nr:right-handed parallel beta-helix repeat-containing protein [Anaerolineales bacterium]